MKYKYWLDNTGLSNGKKNLLLEYFQTAEEVYRGTEETYQKIPKLKVEFFLPMLLMYRLNLVPYKLLLMKWKKVLVYVFVVAVV